HSPMNLWSRWPPFGPLFDRARSGHLGEMGERVVLRRDAFIPHTPCIGDEANDFFIPRRAAQDLARRVRDLDDAAREFENRRAFAGADVRRSAKPALTCGNQRLDGFADPEEIQQLLSAVDLEV